MANCTFDEVRLIIDSTLTDANITALIVIADAEIASRYITSATRTAGVLKLISMYLTASYISARDPSSRSIGHYREQVINAKDWMALANQKISDTAPIPRLAYNVQIEEDA